jgi:NarL family two-component system sensor histidine kinase YdfH
MINISVFIIPKGYLAIFLGFLPILIAQSIGVYYDILKVGCTFLYLYAIFCVAIAILYGVEELTTSIPVLLLIVIAVVAYSVIFYRQIKIRMRAQNLLRELEFAYNKVEELTLMNERQRMARDLHDTLAQGLVGIIMQLDATHANINNGKVERAKEIIENAMDYTRKTLADSRMVINDLREARNSKNDLLYAVENEIAHVKMITTSHIDWDIEITSDLPTKIFNHIVFMVREALNNSAKHAKAKRVSLNICEKNDQINIIIKDDGIGFDMKKIVHLYGHYGILGMKERVKAIGGEINIISKKRQGTYIEIIIPIEEGYF